MVKSAQSRSVRIHLIGHAHLDPVWLWDWREGVREALATFRSAVELMDSHAGYRFVASSAAFYDWVRRLGPGLLQQIRRRVAEGRWEPVGGWWVEADENLPGGEGLIRQGIYGQRLFERLFGTATTIGFNPDAFGHPSSLPRILRALGQTSFFFMRPGEAEKTLPAPVFRWRASDGSEVLAVRIRSYNASPEDVRRKLEAVAEETQRANLPAGVCFYGIGDHGGGPNRDLLAVLDELQETADVELVYSTPSAFLRELEERTDELPVIEGELRHHAVGCYSVDRGVKLRVRRAEHALLALERWQAVDWLVNGAPPDVSRLERAWHTVLFNQFHDILAGTSIRPASEDAQRQLEGVLAFADEESEFTLRRLASSVEVPWPEGGLIVFNPWPWPVRAPIEIEYQRQGRKEQHVLVAPDGGHSPLQPIRRSDVTDLPRSRWIGVVEVPALGYKVYRLTADETDASEPPEVVRVRDNRLESAELHLSIDAQTGAWRELELKEHRGNFLAGAACLPSAVRDGSDTWSHGVHSYEGRETPFRVAGRAVAENGPVRAGVRTAWRLGHSRVETTTQVVAGIPGIFLHICVEWQKKRSLLRLSFPLNLEQTVSVAEEPYGLVRREADGAEAPCQQWLGVEGLEPATHRRRGFLVINDGMWSYSLNDTVLRLTLLRSPVYAHHDPAKLRPGETYDYVDLGKHEFRFWILPYERTLESLEPFRLASVFNHGLRVVKMPGQSGRLPAHGSWLRVDPGNVLALVVKRGVHRSELVLRCFETAGKRTLVRVRSELLGLEGSFTVGPYELKTVAGRRKGGRLMFREVTALEEPL